jgi:uncharacterized RDD family membrane protein YckC
MPEDKKDEEKRMPAIGDPRAGFWVRAVSVLMDIIVLNFLFHGLTFLLREQLFSIARYTEYLGAGIVFLYFALLNGPLGKGKTIGKFLFNIRVQDYQGNPLSFASGFKRTLIQLITPSYILLVLDQVLDKSLSHQAFLYHLLYSLSISFVASNALLIALHPLKQGFHDQFARSLVVKGGAKVSCDDLKNNYQSRLLSSKVRTPASALQSAGLAFIVIFAVQAWSAYQQIKSEQWKANNDLIKEIRAEFAVKDFDLSEIRIIAVRTAKEKEEKEASVKSETTQNQDTSSTGTYVQGKPPFRIRMKYMALRNISREDVEKNEEIQLMLSKLKKWFQEKIPVILKQEIAEGLIPDSIETIFGEHFSLFLYTHEKEEYRFDIPLEVEEFLKIYREKKEPEL